MILDWSTSKRKLLAITQAAEAQVGQRKCLRSYGERKLDCLHHPRKTLSKSTMIQAPSETGALRLYGFLLITLLLAKEA